MADIDSSVEPLTSEPVGGPAGGLAAGGRSLMAGRVSL